MTDGPDSRVTYSVKDLLASVDRRLETILSKLDSKADLSMVVSLKDDMVSLRKEWDEQKAIQHDREKAAGATFSRREKIIGTGIALVSIAMQLAGHIGGGHL